MATKRSMLPPNATRLERAFEGATDKLRAPDVHTLWNAYDCEERLLPWLAWAMGVEVWDDTWPVSVRRSTIAAAMKIARHRGSVWAVKEALIAAGYAGAEIEEGLPPLRHNGAQLRDGLETYGGGNRWAMFRLIADLGEDKGVSGKELTQLTELVNNAKPARSQLTEIEYRASVTDVAAPAETSHVTARPQFSDVRPAGRRRDASLLRSNAVKSPPESTYRNGLWARNSEINRTGVSPYYQWEVTGETRENRWEATAVAAAHTFHDRPAVADPRRTGKAQRDGAFVHGASLPWAYDRIAVTASPALSDEAAPSEQSAANAAHQFSDVRPAGRRRDGSLARSNATQLPPAPTRRDGTWMRNRLIARTGVSPYFDWVITGETRENRWEATAVAAAHTFHDRPAVADPRRTGKAQRDGAFVHGASLPWAYDRIAVTASPALSDEAAPSEQSAANAAHQFSDVRPAGRRRDGSLARHNATQLPPAPTRRDGLWMRNALISRTGVSPYFGWDITGETRENRWEASRVAVAQEIREALSAPSLPRDARYRRDGQPKRGAPNPSALEAATLIISRRQRRNAKLARNAAAPRVANYHQSLTM